MLQKINDLKARIESLSAQSHAEVEALRIQYLSKKGEVSLLFNDFRNVVADQKRVIGQALNELKNLATDKINALREQLETADTGAGNVDLTRSAASLPEGSRHPLMLIRDRITSIFGRLGFSIAEGPEIEDDWHVFSSLNFADDHPARDMQDTFFIPRHPDVLLRSHTSSVQSRVMEKTQPPI
ncbi:MAG: phenylalanine--tRNA ligase subunit alpha, partial [Muribaculaceae bacterium]|nr:phenylalanine--tRNA ligase subunit alpha [Muribaculaceae bacterium]